MDFDGKVIIGTELDAAGAEKDMKKIEKSVKGITEETEKTNKQQEKYKKTTEESTKSVSKLGKAIASAFAITMLVDFGKKAVSVASDLQEVQNVVDTAFGSMSDEANKFADTALEAFGMSELTAKQASSTFMAMATGMGVVGEQGTEMSLTLTGLIGDMSSFYNVSQDVAQTALASVFTGETEALKKFGIVMTESNLQQFAFSEGINKNVADMTEAEKVQLRYNFVLDKTKLAQGDFAKTSDSWANQTRTLNERFKEFMGTIGEDLIIIMEPLLTIFVAFLDTFTNIVSALTDMLSKGFKPFGDWCKNNAQTVQIMSDAILGFLAGMYTWIAVTKVPELIVKLVAELNKMKLALLAVNVQAIAMNIAFGLLGAAILLIANNWSKMNDMEKIVSVLGAVTIAAVAAAIAIGALQSAMSYGIAAAAIAAGVVAIGASITTATKRAKQDAQSSLGSVPRYANGGVFYGGEPMLGILNDQPRGQVNVETPLQTMIDAFNTSLDGRNGGIATNMQPVVNIRFNGELSQLARILKPELDIESGRIGTRLVEGRA